MYVPEWRVMTLHSGDVSSLRIKYCTLYASGDTQVIERKTSQWSYYFCRRYTTVAVAEGENTTLFCGTERQQEWREWTIRLGFPGDEERVQVSETKQMSGDASAALNTSSLLQQILSILTLSLLSTALGRTKFTCQFPISHFDIVLHLRYRTMAPFFHVL